MTETVAHEFTDEQIEEGIMAALKQQNVKVIPSLIALLALQNPERAEAIRSTILSGLHIVLMVVSDD